MPINYEVGKLYEFETIEIRQTPFGSDYIALRDDIRDTYRVYNILKCQYETLPEKIQAMCLSVGELERPKLRQDFYPVLKSLYKKGECYKFVVTDVKTDYNSMEKFSYYQVEDDNAIHRMYIHDGTPNFEIGKEVTLQVDLINAKGYLDLKVPEVEPTIVVAEQEGVALVSVRTGKRPRIKKNEVAPTVLDVNEDVHNELKTSIVFKDGKANIDEQMFVIAKELLAFMNTEGGKLYIGVTDKDRAVEGIEKDYPYLNSSVKDDFNGSYKESEDGYELKIRNYMQWVSMGAANDLMKFQFLKTPEGQTYCCIDVKQSNLPVWLKGTEIYVRVGNRVEQKKGFNLSEFVYKRMAAYIQPGISGDEIAQSFKKMMTAYRQSIAAPQAPKKTSVNYYLNWLDDCTCIKTKQPMISSNVIFQIPVTDDLLTADLYFCYASGTVNKFSFKEFRSGSKQNIPIKKTYCAKEKPMNIFLAQGSNFMAVYGTDDNGYEYVKVHRLTDIPSTRGAINQGSRIFPTGMVASRFVLIHSVDIDNCRALLVNKANARTNEAGTPLRSVNNFAKNEIDYLAGYPIYLTD